MARIDVVVPCYKYAHYLRGCVESVLTQEGVNVRVLILDDCSPDHTPAVAAELVRRDSRVEYRRHEVNRGHIDTYNEGLLEWAGGDYCLLLSADDLLAPGALRRAADVISSNPEVGLVHGGQVTFVTDSPAFESVGAGRPAMVVSGEAFIEQCCQVGGNPVATPTAVVRTALQRTVGGYRKHLPHSADMEMWLRLATRAAVARLDAIQAGKRMHAANMQHAHLTTNLGDLTKREETFASFFGRDGLGLPGANELHGLARHRLSWEAFWAASEAYDRGDRHAVEVGLACALRLDPGLKSSREWFRLKCKRRLGPAWSLVRPLLNRLRLGPH
jgi:glycosyltransferase involved in cell wall biosynthesis